MSANVFREAIKEPRDRLILGLDDMNWEEAYRFIEDTLPYISTAKVNSLADKRGYEPAIQSINELGMYAIADMKRYDTEKVVRNSAKNMTECGATMMTVSASAGESALRAAIEGREAGRDNITNVHVRGRKHLLGGIMAATVLTSQDNDDCIFIFGDNVKKKVVEFAKMAQDTGIEGIMCSATDLEAIRNVPQLDDLLVAVASITTSWQEQRSRVDQKRTATPIQAMEAGADYLMLGRSVTDAEGGMAASTAARRIMEGVEKYRQSIPPILAPLG